MKSLVVYFSHTGENYGVGVIEKGNTSIVADYICEITGADLFEIKPVRKYSNDYKICCDEAKEEHDKGLRPDIVKYLDNIDEYDTIYVGFPIWWGTMPMCVYTFLEHYNFDGKNIKPFVIHEGSRFGNSINDLKELMPNAKICDGIEIRGIDVKSSKPRIEQWIKNGEGR